MPAVADMLSQRNREQLLARLDELAGLARLVRERGQQQPPAPLAVLADPGRKPA
jgi:hypothetical protein